MNATKRIIVALFVVVAMISCEPGKGIAGAYNMVNCKYSYSSISNVSISGINMSNGLSLAAIPQVTSILSGSASSIPVNFTLNMNVNNPNTSDAFLNGLQYIISADNVQLTTGSINQTLSVSAGQTRTLPLNIGVDLAPHLKGQSKDVILNVAKNLAGIGTKQSNITVQLKPTFKVGNTPVTSPIYIPVNFSFGGK